MASGKTHSRVAIALLVGGVIYVAAAQPTWPLERIAAGLFAGFIITPDEDIDGRTAEEDRIAKIPILGKPLAIIWMSFWSLYAFSIPHRHPLSHWPIIGTLFRAAYLTLWLLALALLMGWCGGERNGVAPFDWLCIWHYLWPWGLMAWAVQDLGHAAFDYLPILRRM
jgi:uncharacterized metal-binding protein